MRKTLTIIIILVLGCVLVGLLVVSRNRPGGHSFAESTNAQIAPSTNPITQESNVVEFVSSKPGSSFQPVVMSAQEFKERTRRSQEILQTIMAKDIAEGLNAEARAKEVKLRQESSRLHGGLSLGEVLQLMGPPDVIQMISIQWHDGARIVTLTRTNSPNAVPFGTKMSISYWPRIGVPFNGRNGQGYEVLYVLFDEQHQLERSFWEQPTPSYTSSVNLLARQKDYWEGNHELGAPPPQGGFW